MGGYNSLPQLQMPQSPLEQAGQALQVRAAIGQNQLRDQQVVAQGQENQQRQMALDDQKKVRQAYMQANGDMEKTLDNAAKLGVSPQTLIGLKNTVLEQKQKLATLTKDELANQKAHSELIANAANAVLSAPPEHRPALYQKSIESLVQSGVMKPEAAQQMLAHGYPGDEELQVIGMGAMNAKDQAEARLTSAKMPGAQAESQQKELSSTAQQLGNAPDKNAYNAIFQNLPVRIAQNFPDPSKWSPDIKQQVLQAGMTPHEQSTVPVEKTEMNSWLQQNPGKTPADYERWKASGTTTTSDELGYRTSSSKALPPVSAGGSPRVSGGASPRVRPASSASPAPTAAAPTAEQVKAMTPEGRRAATVDMIGNYQMNPTLMSRTLNNHPGLMADVQAKYPDFDQTQYNLKNKAMMDLAPNGKTGQQVTSYNTFLRHAGALYDAIDTLKNSGYPDWNKPMNWLAQHTGDPRVQAFMAKMQPVQKEFQSFLIGGHALYEDDRKDAKALFDENASPEAMRAVLQSLAHTGGARLSEMNNTFNRATGRDIPKLVSPEAAAAYNKITGKARSGGGNTVKMRAPNGDESDVPADQVDHYKKLGATVVNK